MVAAQSGSEIAAVFHVAQLAWLAGLVVPAAIRSALLPVLGAARSTPIEHRVEMNRALDMCFGLLPYGLFGGYLVVWGFAPLAFPSTFFDGRYGASAVDLFAVLLGGWGLTLLATPTYTGLMAGWRPWRFTQFIVLVLLVALVVGYAFIVHAATSDGTVLFAAAWASTVSAGALLVLSWVMGDDLAFVSSRRDEWALALLGTSFCGGWFGESHRLVGVWPAVVSLYATRLASSSVHACMTALVLEKANRSSGETSACQPCCNACSMPSARSEGVAGLTQCSGR